MEKGNFFLLDRNSDFRLHIGNGDFENLLFQNISWFIYSSRLSFVCLYLRHYRGMIRQTNVHYVIHDSNLHLTYKFKTMED